MSNSDSKPDSKPKTPQSYTHIGEQMHAAMGDYMTLGRYDMLKGLYQLSIYVLAWCVYPLLRYRFGTRSFGLNTILWIVVFLTILTSFDAVMAEISQIPFLGFEYHVKIVPFKLHRFWWLFLALFHYGHMHYEIKYRGEKRYSLATGRSLLYRLLGYLPWGAILARFPKAERWLLYLLDEYSIKKWLEPLLVIAAGLVLRSLGFSMYGTFLLCCAVAMFLVVKTEEDNAWNALQDQIDAELMAEMLLAENEKGVAQKTGVVMRRDTFARMQQSYRREQRAGVQGDLQFAGAVNGSPNGHGQVTY